MSSLVTIVVVTYNSAEYVLDALESVSSQTWDEIELIITDDSSGDDTVRICRNWMDRNKERFVRSELISSEKNTGVSANANRGLSRAKGNWMGFLAGDDALKPGCIADNMEWISGHPEIRVLFSRVDVYQEKFEDRFFLHTIPGNPYDSRGIMAPGRSADSQYRMMLRSDRIHYTPSAWLHRDTLLSVGGFDERFKFLEDYPLWLTLTKNGHRLYFMDKSTVNYRTHSKAIVNTGLSYVLDPDYFTTEPFRKIYIYPYLPADLRLDARFAWYASQIFRWKWINRGKTVNRVLMLLLTVYLNPFRYYVFLKKQFRKDLKKNELYN
jgi:glycosyltransferase involved in cell wall biosynthesis